MILDLIITNSWVITIIIFFVFIILYLISINRNNQKEKDTYFKKLLETEKEIKAIKTENEKNIKQQTLYFERREFELKDIYQKKTIDEIEKIKIEIAGEAKKTATEQLEKWKIENESKIRREYLSANALMRRISKQLTLDLKDDRNFEKLILSIIPRKDEDKNTLIDRIADLIEDVGILMDDNYTAQNAIEKKLNDAQVIFKSDLDKDIFINSITKLLLEE